MKIIAFRLYSPLDTLVKAEPLREDWPGSANLRKSLDTCWRLSVCGAKSLMFTGVLYNNSCHTLTKLKVITPNLTFQLYVIKEILLFCLNQVPLRREYPLCSLCSLYLLLLSKPLYCSSLNWRFDSSSALPLLFPFNKVRLVWIFPELLAIFLGKAQLFNLGAQANWGWFL